MKLTTLWIAVMIALTWSESAAAIDTDGDGVIDVADNCDLEANGPVDGPCCQVDSDGDGIGNACDADYNQTDSVNIQDYQDLVATAGKSLGDAGYDPNVDCNATDSINSQDFLCLYGRFGVPVGSSGLSCADAAIDVLGNPPDPACKAIHADIQITKASSAASPVPTPACFFADMSATDDINLNDDEDILDVAYEVDWGDGECLAQDRRWDAIRRDYSECKTFSPYSGHCYHAAGTYTISGRATRNGVSDTVTATVHVVDADDAYGDTGTVCVRADASGDFSGCTGTTQITEATIQNIAFLSDTRYLFRRGDTFTCSGSRNLPGGVYLAAFGTGTDPLIDFIYDGNCFQTVGDGIYIRDFDVQGGFSANQNWVRRVTACDELTIFGNKTASVNVSVNLPHPCDNLAIVRNFMNNAVGVGSDHLFVQATNAIIAGNTFGLSRGQHVIRISLEGWLAHNKFPHEPGGPGVHVIKAHNSAEGVLDGLAIVFNYINAGIAKTAVAIQPASNTLEEGRHVLFRWNYLQQKTTDTQTSTARLVEHAWPDSDLSGNKIVWDTPRTGRKGIEVRAIAGTSPTNVRVDHNSFHNAQGDATAIIIRSPAGSAHVYNNLGYAPASTMNMLDDRAVGTAVGGNLLSPSAPWAGDPPYQQEGLAPSSAPTASCVARFLQDGWSGGERAVCTLGAEDE